MALAPSWRQLSFALLASSTVGTFAETYSSFRLRLERGSDVSDLFASQSGAWIVRGLQFFSDCGGTALPVAQPLASVAVSSAPKAFDATRATAWTSNCAVGEDSSNSCRTSWDSGAWIGAELSSPVLLRCVIIDHDGAPEGVVVDAWDVSNAVWVQLQSYGAVPASPKGGHVNLRLQGEGICSSLETTPDDSSSDLWLPSCAPNTQWRLTAPSTASFWAVHELEFFQDESCSEILFGVAFAGGGSGVNQPAHWQRMQDGDTGSAWSVSMNASNAWAGATFNRSVKVLCVGVVQTGPSSGDFRQGLESWNGTSWALSQDFSLKAAPGGTKQYLPERQTDEGSQWRLVNDAEIKAAWAVYEVRFHGDANCGSTLAGTAISSDSPSRAAEELPKAFDGRVNTAWVSSCFNCPAGVGYIGQRYEAAVLVRCVTLRQSEDADYRASAVRLERWSEGSWKSVGSFVGLYGGLLQLSPAWGRENTRFVISNRALALGGWRIAELRLFSDDACADRVRGVGISADGNTEDAQRAFDGNLETFWHADCCSMLAGLSIDTCVGCKQGEAWVGIMLTSNETVKCLQMIQKGEVQPRGAPLFASSNVSLMYWNGYDFEKSFQWENIPVSEWVELGVGRARSEIGSALGCRDSANWTKCNNSAMNCEAYKLGDLCNETYLQDTDCEGMTMALSCKASCCLCGNGNPEHCETGEGDTEELPEWLIPAAAGGGGGLVSIVFLCTCAFWRRQTCHERRGCKRCCSCLDRCCKCCKRKD